MDPTPRWGGGPAWRLRPCSISLHPAQAWGGVVQAESWGSPRRGAGAPRVPAPELQEEEVASLPGVQAEEGLRRGEGAASRLSQGLGPLPRASVLGRAATGPRKRPALPDGRLRQQMATAAGAASAVLPPAPTSQPHVTRVVHHVGPRGVGGLQVSPAASHCPAPSQATGTCQGPGTKERAREALQARPKGHKRMSAGQRELLLFP